jgi:diadenosine tetraphosphate (Ap4A) HIT family hydrolase
MTLAALTEEAEWFMPNVQRVEAALSSYWTDDKIERLYVVYFAEALLMGHPLHLHVHLIPRFASFTDDMKAWQVPYAAKRGDFPAKFKRTDVRVNALMEYLRTQLLDTPQGMKIRP